MKLRVLDLFSGIGGFSLGLERTGGFDTVAFCEIEPFPRRVLAKHWPKVPCYDDVRTLTAERLAADGIGVDVICGGFPCQDISTAGLGAGLDGARSGLWSEFSRLIGELRPRYALVENVSNLLSGPSDKRGGWFGRILGDLAALGYDAEWHCIPASAIGAPHRRDRVWVIANANEKSGSRLPSRKTKTLAQSRGHSQHSDGEIATDAHEGKRSLGRNPGRVGRIIESVSWNGGWPLTAEPVLGGGTDGVPNRVDRCGALGNAVVPQIPELIGRAILQGTSPHARRA